MTMSETGRLAAAGVYQDERPGATYRWRMIFSENRCTPRIKCGAGFFRIMRQPRGHGLSR